MHPTLGRDIGCVALRRPVFLPDDMWIEPPRDWPRHAVRGRSEDLSSGEGERLRRECAEAARTLLARAAVPVPDEARESLETLEGGRFIVPRLGQGTFRLAVEAAYEGACAVTEEHSRPALEAAHIQPYSEVRTHTVNNGVLLRADVHKLFDRGYVTIDPDGRFLVSRRLYEEFRNGRSYRAYEGRRVRLPDDENQRPHPDRLAWHRDEVFLG